jgi:hypothetical protein
MLVDKLVENLLGASGLSDYSLPAGGSGHGRKDARIGGMGSSPCGWSSDQMPDVLGTSQSRRLTEARASYSVERTAVSAALMREPWLRRRPSPPPRPLQCFRGSVSRAIRAGGP